MADWKFYLIFSEIQVARAYRERYADKDHSTVAKILPAQMMWWHVQQLTL